MISRQNKYFFLSAHILEKTNSNYRAEQRCLLTKPRTITAMSKNQQKTPSNTVFQRHLLTKQTHSAQAQAQKPDTISWFMFSLSRLYWVLQIPGLPWEAIKFLALLGVTKALTMKTCMLYSRWVCSLADWNNGTQRGVNFPPLRLIWECEYIKSHL